MLVVGDREAEQRAVALRRHREGDLGTMPLDEAVGRLVAEAAERDRRPDASALARRRPGLVLALAAPPRGVRVEGVRRASPTAARATSPARSTAARRPSRSRRSRAPRARPTASSVPRAGGEFLVRDDGASLTAEAPCTRGRRAQRPLPGHRGLARACTASPPTSATATTRSRSRATSASRPRSSGGAGRGRWSRAATATTRSTAARATTGCSGGGGFDELLYVDAHGAGDRRPRGAGTGGEAGEADTVARLRGARRRRRRRRPARRRQPPRRSTAARATTSCAAAAATTRCSAATGADRAARPGRRRPPVRRPRPRATTTTRRSSACARRPRRRRAATTSSTTRAGATPTVGGPGARLPRGRRGPGPDGRRPGPRPRAGPRRRPRSRALRARARRARETDRGRLAPRLRAPAAPATEACRRLVRVRRASRAWSRATPMPSMKPSSSCTAGRARGIDDALAAVSVRPR